MLVGSPRTRGDVEARRAGGSHALEGDLATDPAVRSVLGCGEVGVGAGG